MADNDIAALVAIVETWDARKREGRAFSGSDLRRFVEIQNALGQRMVAITGITNPDLWASMAELAQHCSTLTTPRAKVFADGQDMTNV